MVNVPLQHCLTHFSQKTLVNNFVLMNTTTARRTKVWYSATYSKTVKTSRYIGVTLQSLFKTCVTVLDYRTSARQCAKKKHSSKGMTGKNVTVMYKSYSLIRVGNLWDKHSNFLHCKVFIFSFFNFTLLILAAKFLMCFYKKIFTWVRTWTQTFLC